MNLCKKSSTSYNSAGGILFANKGSSSTMIPPVRKSFLNYTSSSSFFIFLACYKFSLWRFLISSKFPYFLPLYNLSLTPLSNFSMKSYPNTWFKSLLSFIYYCPDLPSLGVGAALCGRYFAQACFMVLLSITYPFVSLSCERKYWSKKSAAEAYPPFYLFYIDYSNFFLRLLSSFSFCLYICIMALNTSMISL